MDKLRLNLLICLILIFLITTVAFLLTLFGGSEGSVSGSVVGASGRPVSLGLVLPGIMFLGFLILTVFYLEKK